MVTVLSMILRKNTQIIIYCSRDRYISVTMIYLLMQAANGIHSNINHLHAATHLKHPKGALLHRFGHVLIQGCRYN
ncbi:uncharacterized protein H6S33_012213 [Morchella sextelata]|uniref:uncharacterized protein n=1 Tax=Morchella sextelata TaxID=1174677 RepID=UPI001D046B01|nr:uncharacterized protein H6S33_012213 [Morchella sextelata]KAH0610686.1 hypothetical protein H6S33_012213 [Morchella sextelata]